VEGKRRWAFIALTLVMALTGIAAGSHGRLWGKTSGREAVRAVTRPKAVVRQGQLIGAGVAVLGPKAPVALQAKLAADAIMPVPNGLASRVSPTFSVGPSGRLPRPLVLEFPLDRTVPQDGRTIVFTAEAQRGPWQPLHTEVTPDGQFARVQVVHLSWYTAIQLDINGALGVLRDFFNGLTSHFAGGRPAAGVLAAGRGQGGRLLGGWKRGR